MNLKGGNIHQNIFSSIVDGGKGNRLAHSWEYSIELVR